MAKVKIKILMKTSEAGEQLIKADEGLRLRAYKDFGGVWTIGYGHTKTAKSGMVITIQKAEELFDQDIRATEIAVLKMVNRSLNQNQFDALVSLVYNIGIGAFQRSSLLKSLNAGNFADAAQQFARWVYVKGVKVAGLVKRRSKEAALFLNDNKFLLIAGVAFIALAIYTL